VTEPVVVTSVGPPSRPPSVHDDTHGGKIREAAASLGFTLDDMLDCSANVNFLGPTPAVLAAARQAVEEISWYPLDPPDPLRRAAADFLGVPGERLLLGNGASELIFLAVAHVRPRRVLILGPTFTEYERAARAWGAEVEVLWLPEEQEFRLTEAFLEVGGAAERIAAADMVFLCHPNNPTGAAVDRRALAWILDAADEAGVPVFVDESFLAFTLEWPGNSCLELGERERLIVLHSFTKILAMPGLRVGALVVSPSMAAELGPRVPPWNVNCVAQSAAVAAFAEADLLRRTPAAVAAARADLAERLQELSGVEHVLPGAANFLCVRLGGPVAGAIVTRLRADHGVLVRDLSSFPGMGPRYLRTAVRSPEENSRLVAALAAVLGSWS